LQDVASRAQDEATLRKLWLSIARHVVEHDKNVEKAMQLIKESTVLRIEDILPFFPDFTRIDLFKVCDFFVPDSDCVCMYVWRGSPNYLLMDA
jgi:hypothetical protein